MPAAENAMNRLARQKAEPTAVKLQTGQFINRGVDAGFTGPGLFSSADGRENHDSLP